MAAGFCTPRPTIVTLNPGQAELGSGSIGPIAVNLSVALKVTWAIFAIVWIVGAFTSKRSVRRQSWASRFGMIAVAILAYVSLLWAATYFGFADHRFLPDSGIYLWIGLFMTIAGVLFPIWARLTLGRKWSGIVTVKQNQELIRTGPYAVVRHPIYTGLTFAVFGTAIFDGEFRSIILTVAVLSALTHKNEDRRTVHGPAVRSRVH